MREFVVSGVDKLQACSAETELREAASSLVEDLGFTGFAYHAFTPENGSAWCCDWPEGWEDHYQAQGYADVDPVVKRGLTQVLPFTWEDCREGLDRTHRAWQILEEGQEFGLMGGADVPIHAPGYEVASFSVYSDAGGSAFREAWGRGKHDLHLLALYFHDTYKSRFLTSEGSESEELTEREAECLVWTARGKTSWEISQILNVSERTVNFHTQNAMHKLDACSKHHAVVRAIMARLIAP